MGTGLAVSGNSGVSRPPLIFYSLSFHWEQNDPVFTIIQGNGFKDLVNVCLSQEDSYLGSS